MQKLFILSKLAWVNKWKSEKVGIDAPVCKHKKCAWLEWFFCNFLQLFFLNLLLTKLGQNQLWHLYITFPAFSPCVQACRSSKNLCAGFKLLMRWAPWSSKRVGWVSWSKWAPSLRKGISGVSVVFFDEQRRPSELRHGSCSVYSFQSVAKEPAESLQTKSNQVENWITRLLWDLFCSSGKWCECHLHHKGQVRDTIQYSTIFETEIESKGRNRLFI